MKKDFFEKLSIVSLTGIGLAVLALTGCRSAGYVKSDAASGRLQRAAIEVRAEGTTLDMAISALNDLINKPSGDLRLQFGRFSQALDQSEKANKRATDQIPGIRKSGAAYFEAWDRYILTLNDDQIHQSSSARKLETVKQFDATLQSYADTENAARPVIDYLKDIRIALSTDLTMGGVQAAREPAKIATDKAEKAKVQLTRSAADLDALSGKMSFFAPPPPAK